MHSNGMTSGANISGALHLGFLIVVLFGADWFSRRDPAPLVVTEVELIDGTNFEARLSAAPVIPNEGPEELAPEAQTDLTPVDLASPDATIEVSEMPLFAETEALPVEQPDFTDLLFPPPSTVVPTEAPRPSIALIPSPDPLERQAAEPESPPAAEPMQALAAAPAPVTAPIPMAPPPPEPAVAEAEPEPKPEEPLKEPEPEALAAAQPDAPIAPAPQQARLPVDKPAELAAAARASSAPPPAAAAPKPAEQPKPLETAGGSTSQFANAVTRGEKDALRLGIKRFFVYNGNRSDRALQVTIRIRLDQDAKILGQPELLQASGGNPAVQQVLFQAGRRALLKAQGAGEFKKLPVAKYDGWKLIHATFTPEEIGFSS